MNSELRDKSFENNHYTLSYMTLFFFRKCRETIFYFLISEKQFSVLNDVCYCEDFADGENDKIYIK